MATMAQGSSPSNVDCTICLEEVSDSCGRTAVTLRCGHTFHLDCIGSAFNVKGAMECPNCREMENGLWQHFRNDNHEEITDEEEDNDEDYDEFEMPEPETRHRLALCLPSPWHPITGEQHYLNRPPVSSVISASLALPSNNNPNNSDPRSGSTSVDGHINGGTQVSVPSADLETSRGEVHHVPNLDSIALPVFLGQGIHDQTPVDSSSGLTNQGNIDGGMQLRINSPSPVVRYSLASIVRSSGSSGWLQFRAGQTTPSLEEIENSNREASDNSIDQTLERDVLVHYRLLAMLELRLAHIRRRIRAEYHQFFPDRANASPDA